MNAKRDLTYQRDICGGNSKSKDLIHKERYIQVFKKGIEIYERQKRPNILGDIRGGISSPKYQAVEIQGGEDPQDALFSEFIARKRAL